jgi:hypothetical protein
MNLSRCTPLKRNEGDQAQCTGSSQVLHRDPSELDEGVDPPYELRHHNYGEQRSK